MERVLLWVGLQVLNRERVASGLFYDGRVWGLVALRADNAVVGDKTIGRRGPR